MSIFCFSPQASKTHRPLVYWVLPFQQIRIWKGCITLSNYLQLGSAFGGHNELRSAFSKKTKLSARLILLLRVFLMSKTQILDLDTFYERLSVEILVVVA